MLKLWTDGSTSHKLQRSGWCAIFSEHEEIIATLSGNSEFETSSDVELTAIIEGLKYYKKFLSDFAFLTVYTDAKFIYDVFRDGYWKKWDFDERSVNWEILKHLLDNFRNKVSFVWVPSHSTYFNDLADKIAKQQMKL